LTSKSYTVKTIFPLQDETVQHILNTYDLTLSEKALLTALDRSITYNHQNFSNYDVVIWQTSILSSYAFHTNPEVKPSFIKTVNKFFPSMDIIVVVQPLQENNQILDKFAKLTQQFDNVYPVNFIVGGVDLTFKETIETIFEVLPTCNWRGRLFIKFNETNRSRSLQLSNKKQNSKTQSTTFTDQHKFNKNKDFYNAKKKLNVI